MISRLKLVVLILLCSVNSMTNAGILGPSDARECLIKFAPKVRLPDALNVLKPACVIGFENNNFDTGAVKVAKCVAKEAAEMYSYESTKKIINKCTRSTPEWFVFYDNKLMANVNERAERSAREQRYNQARIEDEIRESKNGVVSIYDINSGTYKNCIKSGSQLTCF